MGIFRLSPTFYSFIGGIWVSLATNLFTGMLTADTLPALCRSIALGASIVGFLITAIACLLISLRLEVVREEARGGGLMPFLRKNRRYLWINFGVAAFFTAASLAALMLFR